MSQKKKICYLCQDFVSIVGHSTAKCPNLLCKGCGLKGHAKKNCPEREKEIENPDIKLEIIKPEVKTETDYEVQALKHIGINWYQPESNPNSRPQNANPDIANQEKSSLSSTTEDIFNFNQRPDNKLLEIKPEIKTETDNYDIEALKHIGINWYQPAESSTNSRPKNSEIIEIEYESDFSVNAEIPNLSCQQLERDENIDPSKVVKSREKTSIYQSDRDVTNRGKRRKIGEIIDSSAEGKSKSSGENTKIKYPEKQRKTEFFSAQLCVTENIDGKTVVPKCINIISQETKWLKISAKMKYNLEDNFIFNLSPEQDKTFSVQPYSLVFFSHDLNTKKVIFLVKIKNKSIFQQELTNGENIGFLHLTGSTIQNPDSLAKQKSTKNRPDSTSRLSIMSTSTLGSRIWTNLLPTLFSTAPVSTKPPTTNLSICSCPKTVAALRKYKKKKKNKSRYKKMRK